MLEVIHGNVSLSSWFRVYDWYHSNCSEFCDTGCILLVNTQTVLSLAGPGKMSVMVTPNQTALSLFGEPDQASEFCFVYYTNVIHFLRSWQVQEKGSHYFSGVVSTNGRRRSWWTVEVGGGAMVKCQESVYSFKFTYYLMISSFRMIQTWNDNVVKVDIIGHMELQHWKFSLLIHITILAIFNLKLRYFVIV